ncbi:NADPH oxidase 4-like [Ornithodoros turicata]|uniref:NADPH oxidase 4-like n=1 Tax=Ornithodoros turicata TaxID=34597 RepID=UPI003138DE58
MGCCGRLKRRLVAVICSYAILVLWIGINAAIFCATYYTYRYEPRHFYLRQILGIGLCLSRGTAAVLNFNCLVVVIPMCRTLLAIISSHVPKAWLGCVRVCVCSSARFHIICAATIVVTSLMHSVAHMMNAYNFSWHYNLEYKEVNVAQYRGEDPFLIILRTVPGWTGLLMMCLLTFLSVASMKYVRRACYDLFWYTHHLFLLFLLLMICHPLSGVLKEQKNTEMHVPGCHYLNGTVAGFEVVPFPEPSPGGITLCFEPPEFISQKSETWKWVAAALAIYSVDVLCRLVRRWRPTHLVTVEDLPGAVLELRLDKKNFTARPGQYVLLQCPKISLLEWHPFTITSCPTGQDGSFTLHINTEGDWSGTLREKLTAQSAAKSKPGRYPRLYVDGPFCSRSEGVKDHKITVCIAGGIGVTPFAAVLNNLFATGCLEKLERLHFVWICKSIEVFASFADLLVGVHYKMWMMNRPDFFDMQLYVTQQIPYNIIRSLFRRKYELLAHRMHVGRPNWSTLFEEWQTIYQRKKVAVFCCGPTPLNREIRRYCYNAVLAGHRFSFHKESFM